jgi:hypothetical protein
MNEPFFLPVTFKGVEHQFEATLQQKGYVHVLEVDVNGTPVIFERDEEGSWRALLPPDHQGSPPPVDLLRTIGETIEQILQ